MFTGIIEEIGVIESRTEDAIVVGARTVLADLHLGDSIAVNGACLTVTALSQHGFTVGVMPETLRRTNLGALAADGGVNLERPLLPDSRLGGHFVQGHVDGTGTIVSVEPDGNALLIAIEAPLPLRRYIVEKGFIAIDGISLTVIRADSGIFRIGLIPFTQAHVSPGVRMIGHVVNLEVDILAKYVESLVIH